MAKRNFDHGIVHGVVTELSLMKKSGTNCHYFQAQLSESIKVILFDPSLRQSMDTSQKDQKAINLMNCRVQQQKKEETQPQIFLNNHSQIANLPRKIHVPEHLLPANKAIQMSEIKSLADMAKVSVQIKVVNVEHPTEIRTQLGKELPKWDCLVADSSACWSINEKHTLKHCTFKSPWKVCYEYLWVCTFVERLQRSSSLTLLSF